MAKQDRDRRASKAWIAQHLIETRVRETVAFVKFTRAVSRREKVGKSILNAFNRKRFNAFHTPPGAEVPLVKTQWARWWEVGRLASLIRCWS